MRSRTISLGSPVDLRLTLAPLRHGPCDPTIRLRSNEAWRATRTPDGPAGTYLRRAGGEVEVMAWGPGAGWAIEHADDLVGARDDPGSFTPTDRFIARMHARLSGLRMCRSHAVVESLIPTIVEQKVTSAEAHDAFAAMVWRLGDPAPGPIKLMLPPDPARLASLPYWWFHQFGIERKRAEIVRAVCRYARKLDEAASMPKADAQRRMRAIRGIGPWTAAHVAQAALGDPDAVIVGDFHIPHIVTWTLAREPWGSDARMLELLEPYRGHRGRAMRLVVLGGGRSPNRAIRHPARRIHKI